MKVFAFEVSVVGTDWRGVVNDRTAGRAKSRYYRELVDAWPGVPFTALRCRKVGAPVSSAAFRANALYRGLPSVMCGDRVLVGGGRGVIVGHNESANFDVLFDDDSPRYQGLTLNVHPCECRLEGDTWQGI